MKNTIFSLGIVTVILLTSNSFGQIIRFQKTFGSIYNDAAYSAYQTTDGGYIVVGELGGFAEVGSDIYLIKTNPNGDTLWTKTIGGTGNEVGFSVRQTTDGGFIIVGETNRFGAGNEDVHLIKTDSNGDILWTKTYGGSGYDIGVSVQQTTDGGYIIAGITMSFGAGDKDVYLIKTKPDGDTIWTKTFGGIGYDLAASVQQTTDGGYIIAGVTESFGAGGTDVYLIKTDSTGDTLWTKTFGGTGEDIANSVQQTIDGGYIVSGNASLDIDSPSDIYFIKTNPLGDTLWTKTFGGTGSEDGSSCQQTTEGGFIIAGWKDGGSNTDVYLIKTNSNGVILWEKTFGGTEDDGAYSVQQTADGGYIIAGETGSFGVSGTDVYLIKTDGNGNIYPTIINEQTIEDWLLTINPNPSEGKFHLSFNLSPLSSEAVRVKKVNSINEIKVYNVLGEIVLRVTDSEYRAFSTIDLSQEQAGIYFLQLDTHEGTVYKKLLKE